MLWWAVKHVQWIPRKQKYPHKTIAIYQNIVGVTCFSFIIYSINPLTHIFCVWLLSSLLLCAALHFPRPSDTMIYDAWEKTSETQQHSNRLSERTNEPTQHHNIDDDNSSMAQNFGVIFECNKFLPWDIWIEAYRMNDEDDISIRYLRWVRVAWQEDEEKIGAKMGIQQRCVPRSYYISLVAIIDDA